MVEEGESKPGLGLQWARDLEERRAWVLHTPSRVISRVRTFYDGVEKVAVSAVNGRPVVGPVLELEDGCTFVAADESVFVPMEPQEVAYYAVVQRRVGEVARELAEAGAKGGIRRETAFLVIGAALRSTARVTDLVLANPPPAKGG